MNKEIEKALAYLKDSKKYAEKNSKNLNDAKEVQNIINTAIKALEKQLNNGWILCKERLPKYEDTYYCTVKVKDGIKGMQAGAVTGMECVYVSGIWKNVWFQEISHIFDVIAWQPLPETYRRAKIEQRRTVKSSKTNTI